MTQNQDELEKEIYRQGEQLAALLNQMQGPGRNLTRRAVVESIREATTEQPSAEVPIETGNRGNFGAFGIMVMMVGLMFLPILPHMAFMMLGMGFLILFISFLANRLARRSA